MKALTVRGDREGEMSLRVGNERDANTRSPSSPRFRMHALVWNVHPAALDALGSG